MKSGTWNLKRLISHSTLLLIFLLLSCSNKSQEVHKLIQQSEEAMEAEQYSNSLELSLKAIVVSEEIGDSTQLAKSCFLAARSSALSGDFEKAVEYGEKASIVCQRIIDYPLEYRINNTLSWSYFELGKGLDETMTHQQRQLFVVGKLNDDAAKAGVYNNYGYDATVAGTIPLSEVMEYSRFANDYYAGSEGNNGRWYTLMNLTWQNRLINDLTKSEEYGRLSLEQAITDEDRHAIIEASTNLGETLLAQNKIEEARPFYERALQVSQEEVDRDKYVFDVYYSRFLWGTGRKEEAVSLLKSAVSFLEDSEIFYEMLGRAFLATYSYELGDLENAQIQIEKFKNPRANYFSQESKVMAGMVEAQLLSATDPDQALNILNSLLEKLEVSGAEFLKLQALDVKEQFEPET